VAAIEANWAVDYGASEITFSGLHDGNEFKGTFASWTADVAFDPEALETSKVRVVIDMRSASTGKKLYDDSLKGKEWFALTDHPEATVDLGAFKKVANGYESTATLTLKGKPVSVPLQFALDIDGKEARLTGKAEFSRKALDLGQSSDAGGKWIADAVTVTIAGRAERTR
jgi:cytochrome b561